MSNQDAPNASWRCFIRDETAQDTLEYALLLAFIGLAGAAAFVSMSGNINTLWTVANNNLAAANSVTSGS